MALIMNHVANERTREIVVMVSVRQAMRSPSDSQTRSSSGSQRASHVEEGAFSMFLPSSSVRGDGFPVSVGTRFLLYFPSPAGNGPLRFQKKSRYGRQAYETGIVKRWTSRVNGRRATRTKAWARWNFTTAGSAAT